MSRHLKLSLRREQIPSTGWLGVKRITNPSNGLLDHENEYNVFSALIEGLQISHESNAVLGHNIQCRECKAIKPA